VRLEEIHRWCADEAGNEHIRRCVVQHLRLGDLLQDSHAHHRDTITHRHRLNLIVGHIDGRRAELFLQVGDLGTHLYAQFGVEVGKWLVHQEHLRLAHDGATHRHALSLSTRKFLRATVEVRHEIEQ